MAIARVSSTSVTAPGTSGAINTTGANLLVAFTTLYAGAVATPTDSKSNTWTALTERNGIYRCRLFYCLSPTVGSGHTFTLPSGSMLCVAAYSGAASYDQESGSGSNIPGSITPPSAGALLLTGYAVGLGATHSIDGGFTAFEDHTGQGAIAELIQGAAAAANPTWSGGGGDQSSAMASFLPSGGGGGGGATVGADALIYYREHVMRGGG